MTVYNSAEFLPEAITSLLDQTYSDFLVVAVDNFSSDGSEQILREFAIADGRFKHFENPRNLGQVINWNRALQHAREEVPEMSYFAWAGDHDVWDSKWLEIHLEAMESNPNAALAYPITTAIDSNGVTIPRKFPRFESRGSSTSWRALSSMGRIKGIGNMVYGLIKVDSISHSSGLPYCMRPDGPFILDIIARGEVIHIPQPLWMRRYPSANGTPDEREIKYSDHLDRYISHTFDQTPPWHANFPTLTHAAILSWSLFRNPPDAGVTARSLGVLMSVRMLIHRFDQVISEIRWSLKRLFRATRRRG